MLSILSLTILLTGVGLPGDGPSSRILRAPRVLQALSVNSVLDTPDALPGDGVCDDGSGQCTLRAAIEEANALPGADYIGFGIPGPGPHVISPQSNLPRITETATLDGESQPGYAGVPLVTIDGEFLPDNGNAGDLIGLIFEAPDCWVNALAFEHCHQASVALLHGADGSQISRCHVNAQLDLEFLPNVGILVYGSDCRIGEDSPHGNIVNGNQGILVNGSASDGHGNFIIGNTIGVDATGAQFRQCEVAIQLNGADANHVGLPVAPAQNVIANAAFGITLSNSDGNLVRGNWIGETLDGSTEWGCAIGVMLSGSSTGNLIGGWSEGEGNKFWCSDVQVVNNAVDNDVTGNLFEPTLNCGGVISLTRVIAPARRIAIRGNRFVGGYGIVLSGAGPNDTGDADTGANDLQNHPELTTAVLGSPGIVTGGLHSTPNQSYLIDLYSRSNCGPGADYLGETPVTTDGFGDVTFSIPMPAGVTLGQFLTATATDALGNTSQFSPCIEVEADPGTSVPLPADGALELSVFPNPTRGSLRVRFTFPGSAGTRLRLIDLLGRARMTVEGAGSGPGPQGLELALPAELRPGLYLLEVERAGIRRAVPVRLVR